MKRLLEATWLVLTLRCERADRIRAAKLDAADARWDERLAERIHAALCSNCRRARRQIDQVRRVLREVEAAPPEPIPAAARDRLEQRLQRWVAQKELDDLSGA